MADHSFRHQLRQALDGISGPPSPSLAARVRAAILAAPERPRPYWIAGLAAAALAVALIAVLLVAQSGGRLPVPVPGSIPSGQPSPAPSQAPTPAASPSAPAVASPTPFLCSTGKPITVQTAPPLAFIDAIRTGSHPGYDRLTIEFQNGPPSSIEVRPQDSATFIESPRGSQVTLAGRSGLLVIVRGADAHTAYTGPRDFKTAYPVLLQAHQLEDFEGQVQWGLGLAHPGCYSFFLLSNPARLVIDIQTS